MYTLDAEKLKVLRRSRRHMRPADPVTGNDFALDDRIVFCGACMKPHSLLSWRGYANRCSCWRGEQSTQRFAPFEPPPATTATVAPAPRPQWGLGTLVLAIVLALAAIVAVAAVLLHIQAGKPALAGATPKAAATPVASAPAISEPATTRPLASARVARIAHIKVLGAGRAPRTPHPFAPVAKAAPAAGTTAEPSATQTPQAVATATPSRPPPAPRAATPPAPRRPPQRHVTAIATGHVAKPLEQESKPAPVATGVSDLLKSCRTVDFEPYTQARVAGGTMYEKVRAYVTFGDGHKEHAEFPYEWAYSNGDDPWSAENLKREMTVTLQFPPPNTNLSSLPELIQMIIQHTRPDGTSDLTACPDH